MTRPSRTPVRSPVAPSRAAATTSGTGAGSRWSRAGRARRSPRAAARRPARYGRTGRACPARRRTRPGRSGRCRRRSACAPTVPVTAPGWRIEPPVSVPMASGASYAATAARRAAARAARDAVEVPRVVRRAVRASTRWRSPSRTRPCWSCRASTMPASRSRGDDRRVVRRAPALEDLRADGGRHALGGDDVLDRDRHAGQRAELLAGGPARVDRAGGGQRALGVDVQEGVHPVVDGGDPVEVGLGDLDRGGLAGRRSAGELGAVIWSGRSCAAPLPSLPSARSSSRIRGTRNRPSSAAGAPASASSRVRHGRDHVLAEHVGQRHRVRRRRDVGGGDLADPRDRAAGSRRAGRRTVQLLVGDGEPRQPREVRDLVAGDGGS